MEGSVMCPTLTPCTPHPPPPQLSLHSDDSVHAGPSVPAPSLSEKFGASQVKGAARLSVRRAVSPFPTPRVTEPDLFGRLR